MSTDKPVPVGRTSEAQKKTGSDDRSTGTAENQAVKGNVPKNAVRSARYTERRATARDARMARPAVMAATPSSLGKPGWKLARPNRMWISPMGTARARTVKRNRRRVRERLT